MLIWQQSLPELFEAIFGNLNINNFKLVLRVNDLHQALDLGTLLLINLHSIACLSLFAQDAVYFALLTQYRRIKPFSLHIDSIGER